jgi:hypothetical protein
VASKGNLVAEASSTIQHMQKALIEMNVQLSNVLSDFSGVSGMNIIGAILKGERDPGTLAVLVEPEVKTTPEGIAHSLEGNWREELAFVPGQQMELYKVCQEKIAACDIRLRKRCIALRGSTGVLTSERDSKRRSTALTCLPRRP